MRMVKVMRMVRWLPLVAFVLATAGCGGSGDEKSGDAQKTVVYNPTYTFPDFSGERSMELLVRQTSFGSRAPNTVAHDSCLAFYERFLTPLADEVTLQRFEMPGYDGERLRLTNVIARFNTAATQRILLAAHWDSRPRADRETDPARQKIPIPGANDGASGVAVLLHLAEIFAATPPSVGVDIVLFDGEDYGTEGDESMYCLGSKYYSASIEPGHGIMFGILLDLVGDAEARFVQEELSLRYAPDVVRMIWEAARDLSIPRFVTESHSGILDDHVFLNTSAGIKTANIIDAALVGHNDPSERRRYWHTLRDTPEQCSPATLRDVGRVVLYVVYGHAPAV